MKLKVLALVTGLLFTAGLQAQELMTPVPAEMKEIAFMKGKWAGSISMSMGPGEPMKSKVTVDFDEVLGGMYIQGMHKISMEGMGELGGMLMMTYEPKKKQWLSWWFDSSAPGIMDMSGSKQGNSWVFISKPQEIEGMGVTTTRATWTKVSDTHLKMKLEMKQDKDWATFIEADYQKQ